MTTILITFRDGSKAVFTNVTNLDTNGDNVQFSGIDEAGNYATWFIPWSTIKILGKQV